MFILWMVARRQAARDARSLSSVLQAASLNHVCDAAPWRCLQIVAVDLSGLLLSALEARRAVRGHEK